MTKEDYLIEIHQAVLDRHRLYIIMLCEETDEYDVITNSDESAIYLALLISLLFVILVSLHLSISLLIFSIFSLNILKRSSLISPIL